MDCVQRTLAPALSAVGEARHWAGDQCADVLDQDGRQVLELLVSEVVANAVLHGRGGVTVALDRRPGEVVVAVDDDSPDPPLVRHVGAEATGGRGVALVAALAQAWGWQPHPPGKRVWFRVTARG
jgi:anti-sigma regulatory factor (Ser/Thr protein kinase)